MINYKDFEKFEKGCYERLNYEGKYHESSVMHMCSDDAEIDEALGICVILNITAIDYDINTPYPMEVMVSNNKKQVNINVLNEKIQDLVGYLGKCKNLKCLCLEDNVDIVDAFFNISDLKYLFIRGCSVKSKINNILNIRSLKILYLNDTDLDDIPKEIENLSELEVFSIMHTFVEDLPEQFATLRKIKYLGMNGTQIKKIPECVGKLNNLQSLYLGQTKIKELPSCLKELKELRHLAIWETELNELPEWICDLKKLKGLYVGRTKNIKKLPQNIGSLANLQILYLDGTDIIELPESFAFLINLKKLTLSDTRISKFPKLNPMNQLKRCDLSNMVLEKIPRELINSEIEINLDEMRFGGLCLHNTKILCQPISLFSHNKDFIYAYYEEEKIHLNESKIVFLGDGEAGKSHIIRRIQKEGKIVEAIEYQATPGIDIVPKQCLIGGEHINLQLWDFGGQDILHSMHRFFLTERTLYVIVVNARDNTQNERARYWLNNVKSFANGCPVILVLNKMDQNPSAGFNETSLKNDYPQIKEIIKMSALEDEGHAFNCLTDKVFETVKTFDSYAMEFPLSWNEIKVSLSQMRENYVVDNIYRKLCCENGVTDEKIQNWLLEWFHDLGVSFNYRKKDVLLGGYMVLKPQWITNAIYIILFNAKEFAKNGVISKKDIVELLRNPPKAVEEITYTISEIPYIIGVLRRFDISYEIDEEYEFMPMLCNENEHDEVQEFISGECLEYFVEYDYLPNNVLHKLMIRMRSDLQKEKIWLTGMFLSGRDNFVSAVVRMHEKRLQIFIKSLNQDVVQPKEYLKEIRGYLVDINNELGLQAKDMVVYREENMREEIPYDDLLVYLREGQQVYFSPKLRKKVHVKKILGTVETQIDYLQWLTENKETISEEDIRKIMLRLPEVSYIDFEQELVNCCIELQGNYLERNQGNENDLNTYVKSLLSRGTKYTIYDQTLNGVSAGRKASGELDLKVCVTRAERETPLTVVEALKLEYVDKEYIKTHIHKLYGYDTWGAKYNYLLVYASASDFDKFCLRYQEYIKVCELPLKVCKHIEERVINIVSEIRVFDTVMERNGKKTILTHVLINMN